MIYAHSFGAIDDVWELCRSCRLLPIIYLYSLILAESR